MQMVILRMLREQEFLVPDMLAMKYEKEVKDDCKIFGLSIKKAGVVIY